MTDVVRNAPLAVKLAFAFGWGAALVVDFWLFVAVASIALLAGVVIDWLADFLDCDLSDFWEPMPPEHPDDPRHRHPDWRDQ